MADQENLETTPSTALPDQGSTDPKPKKQTKSKTSKHRPDMPTGMFGNTGKAKGKVLNK